MKVGDLQTILFGALIILGLATAGLQLMTSVNTYQPRLLANATEEYAGLNTLIDAFDSNITLVRGQDNLTSEALAPGEEGYISQMFGGALKTLRTLKNSILFLVKFFFRIPHYLGLPDSFNWLGNLIGTAIIFTGLFAVIKAMLKTD